MTAGRRRTGPVRGHTPALWWPADLEGTGLAHGIRPEANGMGRHWKVWSTIAAVAVAAGCATGSTGDAPGRTTTGSGFSMQDARIALSVKAKLTAERAANLVSVNVRSRDAVVYLDGQVPTEADKEAAERIARSVDGVRDVVYELRVQTAATSTPPR
jgi:hyperosmotically inducible protein